MGRNYSSIIVSLQDSSIRYDSEKKQTNGIITTICCYEKSQNRGLDFTMKILYIVTVGGTIGFFKSLIKDFKNLKYIYIIR